MEQYIYDESNGLWYELNGDYYIPCFTLPEVEAKEIGTKNDVTVSYSETYGKTGHDGDDKYAWTDVYTDGKTYNFYGYICEACGNMIITEMDVVYTLTIKNFDNAEDEVKVYEGKQNKTSEDAYDISTVVPEEVEGFKFVGYTDVEGNAVELTTLTENMVVVAVWEAVEVEVE